MLRGNVVLQITLIVMTSRRQNKVLGRERWQGKIGEEGGRYQGEEDEQEWLSVGREGSR